MNPSIFWTEEGAIKAAKERLEREYYDSRGADARRWFEASPEDSYECDRYRVAIYVREGSPPKGMIIVFRALGMLRGYDNMGNPIFLYLFGGLHDYKCKHPKGDPETNTNNEEDGWL